MIVIREWHEKVMMILQYVNGMNILHNEGTWLQRAFADNREAKEYSPECKLPGWEIFLKI